MIKELLRTFTGQLSLGIILFVIIMGAYLTRMFIKLSAQDSNKD
jgi:Protein of unknown function (DUF3149)